MTDPTGPLPPDQPGHGVWAPPQPLAPPAIDTQAGAEAIRPPGRRRSYLLVGAAVITVVLAAGTVVSFANRPSPLEAAREKCGAASDDYAKLGDDGTTLTLRSFGKESRGLSFDELDCYWSELQMPDSVQAEVGATRALDGRQSGNWKGLHASWRYHPDSGLQMVITVTD